MIAGNWKMYKTVTEAVQTARELSGLVAGQDAVEIMIAPPFTALAPVSEALSGSPVALGAQNCHWEAEGAFTGEISVAMLASAGCRYVIIGHSERRQYFGENDRSVNRKLKAILQNGLAPVLCIGETESQRDQNQTFSVLDKQVKNGLEGLLANELQPLVVAYEPVWAIGTGKTATPEQAQEVHKYVRGLLAEAIDAGLAGSTRILYGGSVKPGNIVELMAMPDIDGALVGGASLDASTFSQIVNYK
jgi:triosephosphate isomerase